jgi:hypothetical protein
VTWMIGSPSGVWFCLDVVSAQASMANVTVMSMSVLGEMAGFIVSGVGMKVEVGWTRLCSLSASLNTTIYGRG